MQAASPWLEKIRRGAWSATKMKAEREKFAKLRPPTPEEAQALIDSFIAERGVTRGPSPEQRREMWGMG